MQIVVYAADDSGRAFDSPPTEPLELEGLVAADCPGDEDPRLPIQGWEMSVQKALWVYWERCARVDTTVGEATIRLGPLETTITKLPAVYATPDPAHSTIVAHESGALIIVPRDADGRRIGSGVPIELRSEPPAEVLYIDDGEYVVRGSPERLSAVLDGRFELAVNGGVPIDDCPGGCTASDRPVSGRFWLWIGLLLMFCARRPMINPYGGRR